MNEELRRLIRESGLSMSAVAKSSGLSFSTVQSIWNGDNGATLAKAERLARAIGLELRLVKPRKAKAE